MSQIGSREARAIYTTIATRRKAWAAWRTKEGCAVRIYRDLEYAKSLIKRKDGKTVDDAFEDSEESWTFIGDENDPEVMRRWENMAQSTTLVAKNTAESDTSGVRT